MKIITIIGARPQFIKAATISQAIRRMAASGVNIQEFILHTGQHYDYAMSELFFRQLDVPTPRWHLDCKNDFLRMKELITPILQSEQPDVVIVYGDTTSTLAGAEAASSLHIPLAHIEAGLRSFNNAMPEEKNRILTDLLANWLFCPTRTAVSNLNNEGITNGVFHTGDVMYDAALLFTPNQDQQLRILSQYHLAPKQFAIATMHRAATAENIEALSAIVEALAQLSLPVLLPLHPHTARTFAAQPSLQERLNQARNIHVTEPVGYIEMLALEQQAKLILTDSGGMQKEAYFLSTPCITLRDETEWTETVEAGWNKLAGTQTERIVIAARTPFEARSISDFGDGHAADKMIELLCQDIF